MKDTGLSRREFVLAAGSGAVLAVTGMGRARSAETDTFTALVGRCGTLRLGYSCQGDVPEALVEDRHREQVAFLLALSGQEPLSASCATTATGSSGPATRITSLGCNDGLRLEVITSSACLNGPEVTLRGDNGSAFMDSDTVWFDAGSKDVYAWRSKKDALPDSFRAGYVAYREEAALARRNDAVVEMLLQSAITA